MSKLSFTSSNNSLLKALSLICQIPGNKQTLTPVTIEAGMEGVILTRRTPSAWVKVEVEDCIVDEDGAFSIFPESALKLVNSVSGKDIDLEVTYSGGSTEFKGRGKSVLKSLASGEIGVAEPKADFTSLSLSCEELREAMAAVAPACQAKVRPNLDGMIFGSNFPGLSIIGADGKRFHRVSITKRGLNPSILLPPDQFSFAISALAKAAPKAKASLKLAAKLFGLDIPGVSMRLTIAEDSPLSFAEADQKRLYTEEGMTEVSAERAELQDVADRATSLADDLSKRISIHRERDKLIFNVESQSDETNLDIPCSGDALEEPIYISGINFKDAIKVFHAVDGKITIKHLQKSGFIRIEEGNKTAICYLQIKQ